MTHEPSGLIDVHQKLVQGPDQVDGGDGSRAQAESVLGARLTGDLGQCPLGSASTGEAEVGYELLEG